nr:MAG TPA: hypothetical protein [Caudoviricetes sp.]
MTIWYQIIHGRRYLRTYAPACACPRAHDYIRVGELQAGHELLRSPR